MGSPVFGYLGDATVKTPVMGQAPYQVTLEDRMRWAQIADVMAQANHYGVNLDKKMPTNHSLTVYFFLLSRLIQPVKHDHHQQCSVTRIFTQLAVWVH